MVAPAQATRVAARTALLRRCYFATYCTMLCVGVGLFGADAVELQLRGSLSVATGEGVAAEYSAERGFCELCMHTIHQVQYGSLPSCAQSAKSYGSCSQTVQVILGQAASVLQLIEEGCYQYDSYKGWQTIKPCPSHAICGRLHNSFDVDQATLCPKDFHYRFPTALGQVHEPCKQFIVVVIVSMTVSLAIVQRCSRDVWICCCLCLHREACA